MMDALVWLPIEEHHGVYRMEPLGHFFVYWKIAHQYVGVRELVPHVVVGTETSKHDIAVQNAH